MLLLRMQAFDFAVQLNIVYGMNLKICKAYSVHRFSFVALHAGIQH